MKYYTVIGGNGIPPKIYSLMGHFAKVMLKNDYQVRTGIDHLGDKVMNAALNEGEIIQVGNSENTLFPALSNSPLNDQVMAKAYEIFGQIPEVHEAYFCQATGLLFGSDVCGKSKMLIIWQQDYNHLIYSLVKAANLTNTPVLRLHEPADLKKIIDVVRKAHTQSPVQKMARMFKR